MSISGGNPEGQEIVLRAKNREALAIGHLADNGSFSIETHWSRKRTIFLEVGDFYVPVVRALDRSRTLGSETPKLTWASAPTVVPSLTHPGTAGAHSVRPRIEVDSQNFSAPAISRLGDSPYQGD